MGRGCPALPDHRAHSFRHIGRGHSVENVGRFHLAFGRRRRSTSFNTIGANREGETSTVGRTGFRMAWTPSGRTSTPDAGGIPAGPQRPEVITQCVARRSWP